MMATFSGTPDYPKINPVFINQLFKIWFLSKIKICRGLMFLANSKANSTVTATLLEITGWVWGQVRLRLR